MPRLVQIKTTRTDAQMVELSKSTNKIYFNDVTKQIWARGIRFGANAEWGGESNGTCSVTLGNITKTISLSSHNHDSIYVYRKFYSVEQNTEDTKFWIRGIALEYPCSVIYNNYGAEWTYWVGLNPANKSYGHIIRASYSGAQFQFMTKAGGAADTTTNWSGWITLAHSSNSSITISGTTASIKLLNTSVDVSLSSHTHSYLPDTTKYAASDSVGGHANYSRRLIYYSQITKKADLDAFHEGSVFKCTTWNGSNAADSLGDSYPGAGNGIILDGGWTTNTYGFQLAIDDDPNWFMALRQMGNGTWASWKRIPMGDGTGASGTWAINISGKATTAGTADSANSVAWTNVSGRPTNVSSFTNDSGYITSSGLCYGILTSGTSQAADACYNANPGLHFYRYNGTSSTTGQSGGDGWILQWSWGQGSVGGQLYFDDNPSKTMCIRGCSGSSGTSPTGFTTWATIIHSDNYTTWCVDKTTYNTDLGNIKTVLDKINGTSV